jgi:hypothetical protein
MPIVKHINVDYFVVIFSLCCIVGIYLIQERLQLHTPSRLVLNLSGEHEQQLCLLVTAYEFVRQHSSHFAGGMCVQSWKQQGQWRYTLPRFPVQACPWNETVWRLPVVRSYDALLSVQSPSPTSVLLSYQQHNNSTCQYPLTKYFKLLKYT